MATKLPPKPENLLEEIMCDSDLDYLVGAILFRFPIPFLKSSRPRIR
jgi:hypothetical protein